MQSISNILKITEILRPPNDNYKLHNLTAYLKMLPVKQAELDGTDDVDINHMTQAHANSYRYSNCVIPILYNSHHFAPA